MASHPCLAETYDVIVCGAGSSDSVVAGRIAENAEVKALLLEAGGSDDHEAVRKAVQRPLNLGGERDWISLRTRVSTSTGAESRCRWARCSAVARASISWCEPAVTATTDTTSLPNPATGHGDTDLCCGCPPPYRGLARCVRSRGEIVPAQRLFDSCIFARECAARLVGPASHR
jgi:hypothetical protein